MKKRVLLFAMAILSFAGSYAQISKGNILLGAQLGYGNSGGSFGSSSNSNLSPRIGYAVSANSVLNARVNLVYNKATSADGLSVSKANNYSALVGWQRFFAFKDRLGWFTELNGGIGVNKNRQVNSSGVVNVDKANFYTASLSPGIYFIPSPGLQLTAKVGGVSYEYLKQKPALVPSGHRSTFNVDLLNYFTFGVDFILHKNRS